MSVSWSRPFVCTDCGSFDVEASMPAWVNWRCQVRDLDIEASVSDFTCNQCGEDCEARDATDEEFAEYLKTHNPSTGEAIDDRDPGQIFADACRDACEARETLDE